MDAAKKGASALEAGRFGEAIDLYTTAIREHPESTDYYIQRAAAHRRNKQTEQALVDADLAVFFANKRARRELIAKAQFERGVGLYTAGRFADARQCFLWSEEYNAKENRLSIWKIKVDDKLKTLADGDENGKVSVSKVPSVDLEKAKAVNAPATAKKDELQDTASQTCTQPASATVTPAAKIRHDWYQSTDTVTVTLLAKNVPKDKAQITIEPRALSISFPLSTGSDYDFSIVPLFGEVDVSSSTYKVMSTKIEIVLRKSTPGNKWAKLEADSVEASTDNATAPAASQVPSYPTSSRSGPKNWDNVVRDIRRADKPEGEDVGDDDDDDDIGQDEANGFFKKLYKNSSPDVRRAMMKSYQESNGTALSTNWSEVETHKYETMPPDGMEAKKW